MQSVVFPSSDNEMKYILLVLVVCSVGILMIPNAFAVNERTIEVKNAPGSLVPGCEETNGCFLPDRQSIKPGDTIVWTNPDTMSHYVASGTSSGGKDGGFDSGMIAPGQTFEHQFTKSGLYNYFCSAHPWMEGIIIVEEGPDWVPPSTPSPPSSSTSKTPTNLILDPLPTTFKADYQPASGSTRATITFSGELETADKKFYITDAPITLKFIGFTLDGKNHYEITTDNKGLFNFAITLLPGNDYGIQAVFDGGQSKSSGKIWAPSKSQTEYFIVTSSSSQPTSSIGGPTFLKLEVEADKRVVTIIGKLTDKATKKYTVRNEAVTLIPSGFSFTEAIQSCSIYGNGNVSCYNHNPTCLSSYLPNCVLKTNTVTGEFATRFNLPVGEDYSVQAVFHGTNQWDASKSLTQSFTVSSLSSSTSKSLPPTSTSSEDFGWIWILVILGVVFAGVAAVLAKRNKKKTPTTAPQRRTFGVKQPKKRRTGSPASVPPSGTSASTFAHYECPDCHSDNIIQYQDGAESCSDCGWKT